MNKQSNIYTTIYIIVLVLIVGTALAVISLTLRDKQQANENADKMKQILASVNITATDESKIVETFNDNIIRQMVVNSKGEEVEGNAFEINVAQEIKLPADERKLPVYVCKTESGDKYILPAYGAGLWGPIWGYISVDGNGSTIYGAYFAHQGETPGLGAEIEKPAFSNEFKGLNLFKSGEFYPISVVKNGQKPTGSEDYVNGISGGTITSKGVGSMLDNCLSPYKSFLENLNTK